MSILNRILRRGAGRPAAPGRDEVAPPPEDVPASLFLLGSVHRVHVGMRFDFAGDDRPWGMRTLPDRPVLWRGWHGFSGHPPDERIWRLVPDDPAAVWKVPRAGFWTCRSATVVEKLSPAVAAPAWGDLVLLWLRLEGLTHEEAVRIAPLLGDPGDRPPDPETEFGYLAAHAVGSAARSAEVAGHDTMRRYRAGGGSYEDIIDPAWLRIEAAAIRLADGLAAGDATLARDAAHFGPWDPPG